MGHCSRQGWAPKILLRMSTLDKSIAASTNQASIKYFKWRALFQVVIPAIGFNCILIFRIHLVKMC